MAEKKNTTLAAVAYILFFAPLLTKAKDDPFVRFHVRQGLGLLITFFAFRFLTLFLIAPLYNIATPIFLGVLYITNIAILGLLVLGIWNAVKGEQNPLPVIGPWAEKYLKL